MTINKELITTTVDHSFYVKEKGFINAGELQVGDRVVNASGDVFLVKSSCIEAVEIPETVYNFQVEDFHTYHVGVSGVLVHNANYGSGNTSEHMFGSDGTQVSSKTIWQNGKTERIDVENPAPEERPGQVHYHDVDNNKYYYDIDDNTFYDQKTGELAPKSIQKLLNNKNFMKGIKKHYKF